MPNLQSTISLHNHKNMAGTEGTNGGCNCRVAQQCPLYNKGGCLQKDIIYQATVSNTTTPEVDTYVGQTSTTFKERFSNHKTSFNNAKYKASTELSKRIWELRAKNIEPKVSWEVLGKAKSYSNKSKRCGLCSLEKYFIIYHKDKASLNQRSEFISKCLHENKFLLEKT